MINPVVDAVNYLAQLAEIAYGGYSTARKRSSISTIAWEELSEDERGAWRLAVLRTIDMHDGFDG